MITILKIAIVLTFLFAFLSASTLLMLGVTFTRAQRKRYRVLKLIDGKQIYLAIATVAFLALSYGAYTCKEILAVRLSFEVNQGPFGDATQKATYTAFDRELQNAAVERMSEARDYFRSAERDFAMARYQDAAGNYEKSVKALPTMSAYLNLGISLRYSSGFAQSEAA